MFPTHQSSQYQTMRASLWKLTVRECRLGLASLSTQTFTFLDKSQSIKIPVPFFVIKIFPALMSRCKIWALLYAAPWAIGVVSLKIDIRKHLIWTKWFANPYSICKRIRLLFKKDTDLNQEPAIEANMNSHGWIFIRITSAFEWKWWMKQMNNTS